jgi:RNA methyltransferase, TrmH family
VLLDPKSARVRGVLALKRKETRYESGLFLLEGPQGLKELTRRPELANEVFVTSEAAQRYSSEIERLQSRGVPVVLASEEVIDRIAETQHPQGVVAVVHHLDLDLDELEPPQLVVILDRVRDPGNAGTVIRAADAAGADAVIFSTESVDLYNSKLVRATAGSIFNVASVIEQAPHSVAKMLRAEGVQIFATSAGGTPITELDPSLLSAPTAWIFGNEAEGVSAEWLAIADKTVALPIFGSAESLNIATAASVCLYASAFMQNSTR